MNIRDYIKTNQLLTDGAMGTYYAKAYPAESALAEESNLTHPKRILEIHKQYLEAGARMIRTNTFAVNGGFFEEEEVRRDIIRKGYEIARQAILEYRQESGDQEPAYIAADIGTLYDYENLPAEELRSEYRQMVDTFLEAGAEIFWLETQADFMYLSELTEYIKEKNPQAFVMVSFSFDKTGYTKAGVSLSRMMDTVSALDTVDAYGLNCGVEPVHMYEMLSHRNFPNDKPFIALANAGYPLMLRGRTIFSENTGYFADQMSKMKSLGVDVIGGCCGTTPNHILKLKRALDKVEYGQKNIDQTVPVTYEKSKSKILEKLDAGQKPFLVELDPPSNLDYSKIIRGAEILKEHDVDLLTLSDSPLARTRMDSTLLSAMIQKEVGIQVMPHITCRDRNVISLRGTMMGAHVNGLRHYLIVTGDPVNQYDRSMTSQVFDFNSIRFMSMVQEMNHDTMASDPMVYGGALNYHGTNIKAVAGRMKQKMEQGCSYFLTQPIYSDWDVQRIKELREMTGAKIMAGIMPLVSYKNAQFMANEMPGIRIPDEVVNAYRPDMTRTEAEEVATQIAVDIAMKLKDVSDGYYFMVPFNRVNLITGIIEEIRKNL